MIAIKQQQTPRFYEFGPFRVDTVKCTLLRDGRTLPLSAKGFEPLAMTDCLNFGNPEKKEIMSEFVASVEALAKASKLMDAPVISGNVTHRISCPAISLGANLNSRNSLPITMCSCP